MIYLFLVCAIFLTDFLIKTHIEIIPKKDFPIRLLDGHIELHRLHNKGLAGSRLEDKPDTATACAGLAFIGCVFLALPHFFRNGDRIEKLGAAMITGGAAGNLFDRLGRGYVVDYLSFPKAKIKKIRRFVYNLADLFIFLGSGLLLLRELLRKA